MGRLSDLTFVRSSDFALRQIVRRRHWDVSRHQHQLNSGPTLRWWVVMKLDAEPCFCLFSNSKNHYNQHHETDRDLTNESVYNNFDLWSHHSTKLFWDHLMPPLFLFFSNWNEFFISKSRRSRQTSVCWGVKFSIFPVYIQLFWPYVSVSFCLQWKQKCTFLN